LYCGAVHGAETLCVFLPGFVLQLCPMHGGHTSRLPVFHLNGLLTTCTTLCAQHWRSRFNLRAPAFLLLAFPHDNNYPCQSSWDVVPHATTLATSPQQWLCVFLHDSLRFMRGILVAVHPAVTGTSHMLTGVMHTPTTRISCSTAPHIYACHIPMAVCFL
jgi:hypothetical protein